MWVWVRESVEAGVGVREGKCLCGLGESVQHYTVERAFFLDEWASLLAVCLEVWLYV